MASNPMQRKARNSFLLGVIITLLIAACIIGFLFTQMNKYKTDLETEQKSKKMVYVLNQDVESGQTITQDMFSLKAVSSTAIPTDAQNNTSLNSLLVAYSLCDKNGNAITSEKGSEGERTFWITDENGEQQVFEEKEGNIRKYYKKNGNQKELIETTEQPIVSKIALKANTVLTSSMLARSDKMTTNDLRKQEYNMIVLPMDVMTGDYIDVRLMLPNGQDFIVISKKEVEVPIVDGTSYSVDTIWMNLTEDEILTMSSAIVEAYMIDGSKLYAAKYTDAGMQEAAVATYMPSNEVINLMNSNKNITDTAKKALSERYNSVRDRRNDIEGQKDETSQDKVPAGMNESIQSTQEERKTYLESLMSGAGATTTTSGAGTTGTTTGTGTTK